MFTMELYEDLCRAAESGFGAQFIGALMVGGPAYSFYTKSGRLTELQNDLDLV